MFPEISLPGDPTDINKPSWTPAEPQHQYILYYTGETEAPENSAWPQPCSKKQNPTYKVINYKHLLPIHKQMQTLI